MIKKLNVEEGLCGDLTNKKKWSEFCKLKTRVVKLGLEKRR
jgi:hypothetical protein